MDWMSSIVVVVMVVVADGGAVISAGFWGPIADLVMPVRVRCVSPRAFSRIEP